MPDVLPPPGEFDEAPGEKTESPAHGIEGSFSRLRLIAFTDPEPSTFDLPNVGRLTVGRGDQADLTVKGQSISRVHAALYVEFAANGEPQFELEDLGSANGTRVQGRELAKGERVRVSAGEVFDVGAIMMMVQGGSRTPAARPHRMWTHGDFETKVEEECARAEASGKTFAILRVRTGDVEASRAEEMLVSALRPFDAIARYAPGEYEMLVIDATPELAGEIRAKLLAEMGAQIWIGVACYPSDGRRPEDLAARAGSRDRDASVVVVEESRMGGLFRLVDRVAPSDITILILGETGVGKEVMAERIHKQSKRASKPLLRLNCAALVQSLLESELFGHEKNAFTGADVAKPGLFESADGGTVFLDEIGELATAIQVKLLRVLEERKVLRVGGREPIAIDVRFIAATNRDLEGDIARGTFRSDLFYRLNGVTLSIPPLRERRMEIAPLARAFASGKSVAPAAMELLEQYYWPGNIRELKNVIERAVLLAGDGSILREHLPLEKLCATTVKPAPAAVSVPLVLDADPSSERARIVEALAKCVGNQTQAAALLGISRSTLVARLNAYQIPRPRKR